LSMSRWQEALRVYRRRPMEGASMEEPSNVMFVLCSESHAAAAVVAACEPAMVLQILGGASSPLGSSAIATIEYAVKSRGVRHLVVCGHDGCRAGSASGRGDRAAMQAETARQCLDLGRDSHLAPLLRSHGVTLRALWFDEAEGDVYLCDVEGRSATLLDDRDFARMLSGFAGRST